MDGQRLDALARTFARATDRRTALRSLFGSAAAGLFLLGDHAAESHNNWSRCKNIASKTKRDKCIKKGNAHKKWHESNACRGEGQKCGSRPCCVGEALFCGAEGVCRRRAISGPKDPLLTIEEVDASEASIDRFTMRTPWPSYPGYAHPTWKVIVGYESGKCHYSQPPADCGGDQRYSLDLKPESVDAGGRLIVAPLRARVAFAQEFGTVGHLIKLEELDDSGRATGYRVHLYHLMDLQVTETQIIDAGTPLGWVYDEYPGENHLHLHVSNPTGQSVPFKLAGKSYPSGPTWKDQKIRNNVLYSGPNFGGDRSQVVVANDGNYGDDHIGNDNVSSLRVNEGCTLTLHRNIEFSGGSKPFSGGSHGDLADFNNITSSHTLTCV